MRRVSLILTALMLLVTAAEAGVPSDTWHYDDATTFWSRTVYYSGDSSVDCCIGPVDDMGTCYIAVYYTPYTASKVSAAIIAAAEVSSRTSWSSSYVGVMFDGGNGEAYAMSTADARHYYNNWQGWSDNYAQSWVASHLVRL